MIVLPKGKIVQGIVLIENGVVVSASHFEEEQPMTEWLAGTIVIKADEQGVLRAYKESKLLA